MLSPAAAAPGYQFAFDDCPGLFPVLSILYGSEGSDVQNSEVAGYDRNIHEGKGVAPTDAC